MQCTSTIVHDHMPFKPSVISWFWVILWKFVSWGNFWQIPIKSFSLWFLSPDSPMMYLVRQQGPNTENIGLISNSELLHAVTKLSLWCYWWWDCFYHHKDMCKAHWSQGILTGTVKAKMTSLEMGASKTLLKLSLCVICWKLELLQTRWQSRGNTSFSKSSSKFISVSCNDNNNNLSVYPG